MALLLLLQCCVSCVILMPHANARGLDVCRTCDIWVVLPLPVSPMMTVNGLLRTVSTIFWAYARTGRSALAFGAAFMLKLRQPALCEQRSPCASHQPLSHWSAAFEHHDLIAARHLCVTACAAGWK